ncbi:hypothetical protein ACJMK2_022811 [Sinanodonta woodiana]|uniref:cAMP-regulated phosphoprotein 21 n=1 Tax=Sinanodonta woodiana TaxID=1069815 RepID=A0ABD3TK57_SINWO
MMATEKYEQDKRAMKVPQLRKQPEIEEVEEEEDTSPGSDQSDVTITAGGDTSKPQEGSPESISPDLKTSSDQPNGQNHISPKNKQLTRSQALCEECASPPPDRWTSTASTGSTDSSSSGVGSKSVTSGYCSGSGRLEKDGSQTGSEAGTLSSLSRDSSVDSPYKDSTGIDLEEFIRKTLNKTSKDRSMLLKLETDLTKFIREPKHHYLKFPPMSSYDRMLVHRIAAFFGLDHNVDQTGKCVIVNKTANTRIPEFSFVDNVYTNDAKPKMVLKRGGRSLDERESKGLSKESLAMTRAKSLEERQQKYEEARSRIFTTEEEEEEEQPTGYSREDAPNVGIGSKKIQRPYSLESSYNPDSSGPKKIIMPKANSFGGTGNFPSYIKAPVRGSSLSKAGSIHLQSTTPKVYWVASDPQTIPPGSIVINPQTGQPYLNTDGTPYRYMPGQPLPQPTVSYSPGPQPVYQLAQEESSSTSELCQPVSVIRLTSQSPSDGSGEPSSMSGATSSHPSQAMVVSNQGLNLPQGYAQHQQQNVYYPASQTLSGQPVRYISYSSPAPVGQVPQGVSVEGQSSGQPYPVGVGPYPAHYVQGYGYPSVHYGGVSQGSDGSACCSQPGTYQTTSQSESASVQGPGYGAYSIQYSQGVAMPYPSGTAGQPAVYYSIHSQSSQPVGYSSYPAPTLYQGTSPPSHTLNAANFHPVGYNLGQAMSYSQAPTSATGPQPVTSQYISYPSYQHRATTPQVVPFPNVHSSMPQNPPQSFQTLFRPSSMQFGVQMQQQQQQPIQVSAAPMPGVVTPSQHGHVTVSAKGLSSYQDNQVPKIESIIENHKEVGSGGAVATTIVTCHPRQPVPINRPPHMTSGDMRLLGQPQLRAQVASAVQFTTPQQQPSQPAQVTPSHHQSLSQYQQQQQPQRVVVESGLTPKPQRVRKSRSREGQISNHNSSTDLTETGNTLEVYDLVSNLRQTDAEKMLKELTSHGARLHFVKKDVKKGSDSNQGDKNNLMISDYAKVLAVFPDKSSALSLLQNHKNNAYKLRVVNESIDGKE